ncbi:MAG: tyrosine--tRNA ligase [Thermodesulfobacteriota bacterium]
MTKLFNRTVDEMLTLKELKERLNLKRPLRIKYGVDVTAPFIHIGHAVNLWMMRELQGLGHKVIFLIGDFTTRIGDPTGKSETRPIIPEEEIEENAQEFIQQVSSILITDDDVFEIRRNSEWFDNMSTSHLISLLSMVTHARLISREMFQERIGNNKEIYMHELIYPVLQGYDSLMIEADLTIVGTDQLFNEMMGRFFQEKFSQPPQVIITTKITPGIDGKEKQSKSLGNYIALKDTPRDKFGKIMSVPDNLIMPYLEVYTMVPLEEIVVIRQSLEKGMINPRDTKLFLAEKIVERYHGTKIALHEKEFFVKTFSEKETPTDIPELTIREEKMNVLHLLKILFPDISNSECKRLIMQGAVDLNGDRLVDPVEVRKLETGDVIRVGKRNWRRLNIAKNPD